MKHRSVTRRNFLALAGAGAASCWAGYYFFRSKTLSLSQGKTWVVGSLVGNYEKYLQAADRIGGWSTAEPSLLNFFNIESQRMVSIAIPFFAHSFEQNPVRRETGLAISRWTPHAAIVNLSTHEIARNLISPEGSRFFGHGIYSPDGERFYISGNSNDQKRGLIFEYTHNGDFLSEMSTGGLLPHQMIWLETGEQLLIANAYATQVGQGPANVACIDVQSKKVTRSWTLPYATHLARGDRGLVLVGARARAPDKSVFLASLNTVSGEIVPLHQKLNEADYQDVGEALSFVASRGRVVGTSGEAGLVFSIDDSLGGDTLQSLSLPRATGGLIFKDDFLYLNSWRKNSVLYRLPLNSSGLIAGPDVLLQRNFANSSHLGVVL